MGNIYDLAASSSSKSSSSYSYILIILVIFVAFYFLMIRPQQRRRQQAAQQQNTVAPGARVRTTAGMYATVVEVDGDDVVLEVAPGIEVRYMRRAIMDVVTPGEPAEEEAYEAGATDDPADEDVAGEDGHEVDSEATTDEAISGEAEYTPEAVSDADDEAYEKATGGKKD